MEELKQLKVELTQELVFDIIDNNDAKNTGIFISLLANEFINKYGITREEFLTSLVNSLNILEEK